MSCSLTCRGGGVVVTVTGFFDTHDANLVESVLDREQGEAPVVVDLSRAGNRTPLALWLLALQVRKAAGRCRVTGFTEGDLRFLHTLGCDPAGLAAST